MVLLRDKQLVIDPERVAAKKFANRKAHFIYEVAIPDDLGARNTFLILNATTLNKFAPPVIKKMTGLDRLRVVFLLKGDKLDQFFDYLAVVDKSVRSKICDVLHLAKSVAEIDEIIASWCDGSQDERIARALVQGDVLAVTTHAMKTIKIGFDEMPALRKIPVNQRDSFVVGEHGRKIVWKDAGVDVDLDGIRYHTEPKFRRQQDLYSLNVYSNVALAVKAFRESLKLSQQDISDRVAIAVKTLSRIENGHRLTENTLAKLAEAHGMKTDDYVRNLLRVCDELQREEISRKARKSTARKSL